MVRNGQQLARVYTTAGARSGSQASESARIQRVKFGSASNQWGLYKYVSTRMYRKGKSNSQSDYNYFVKKNADLLPYFTKLENSNNIHVLMPGLFSEGNLGKIDIALNLTTVTEEGVGSLSVIDTQHRATAGISWTVKMSVLKSYLASIYSSASKITFLFSIAPSVQEVIEGVSIETQSVTHHAVSVDLYKEAKSGEDDMTISEYFASMVNNTSLAALFTAQNAGFASQYSMMALRTSSTEEYNLISSLSVLIFAANDNVSDVYTTTMTETGSSAVRGAYVPYHQYRTNNALRLACESYGYQSGVMRDDIASFGNELEAVQAQFVARMRSLGVHVDDIED